MKPMRITMNKRRTFRYTRLFIVLVPIVSALASGCGGPEKKDPDFFTSGNREADQRAEQRMAKAKQLSGEGQDDKDSKKAGKKPLFDRLGGDQGIKLIVDDFIPRALADPRVNWERKGIKSGGFLGIRKRSVEWSASGDNVSRLKTHIEQFLSLATGGPAKYEGGEMKQVHNGLRITNAEFDAAVGDLKASLDKLQVPSDDQKELLAIIESTRTQVVEVR